MKGKREFSTANRLKVVKEEMGDGRKPRDDVINAKLEVIVNNLKLFDLKLYLCVKQVGSCLTILGTMVTGRVLLAMEFCDSWCARYNISPP